MNVMNNIGDLINKLRIDFDMTQDELATVMGVSKPAVSQWEHGKGIKTNYIYDIAKLFNVTVDELCSGKLNSESNDEYLERKYNLTNYDFSGPITKNNLSLLEKLFHHVKMIRHDFFELLPKWSNDELAEDEERIFNVIKEYFKFDSNYYSFVKGFGGYISFSQFGSSEKQFVKKIIQKTQDLTQKEKSWELCKVYYFDSNIVKTKIKEIFESQFVDAIRILLLVMDQPNKDSLLMNNLVLKETEEVDIGFEKAIQNTTRELSADAIEHNPFIKIMLENGCNCMMSWQSISSISEDEMLPVIEGKIKEIPIKKTDSLENVGLFMGFGGNRRLDVMDNWKLYSYKAYNSFIDINKTNYLKSVINYRDTNPIRYFQEFRRYHEDVYMNNEEKSNEK